MSKRAERRQRQAEKLKKSMRNALYPGILGLILLVLGCIGIFQNITEYNDFKNTENALSVPAEVTYAELKSVKREFDTEYNYYNATVKYTAEGKEYSGKLDHLNEVPAREFHRLKKNVNPGDIIEIDIYKAPNGEYRILGNNSVESTVISSVIPLIGAVVGAFLLVASILYVIWARQDLRKLTQKPANKGNGAAQE